MHIHESFQLPLDVWGNIFKQGGAPLSFSCICKSFYFIFSKVAFDVYLDHPSLKERARHIEQRSLSSEQEKIKALYESLMDDVKRTNGYEEILYPFSIEQTHQAISQEAEQDNPSVLENKDAKLMRQETLLSVERFAALESWLEDSNLINLCEEIARGFPTAKDLLKGLKEASSSYKAEKIRTWFQENKDELNRVHGLNQALQFTKLPREISQLIGLKTLCLQENQLISLPVEMWQLTNLRALYLNGNQLISLPVEMWQLTHLAVLDLGENQLTSMPVEIGRLTGLEMLYVDNNELTSLPAEMGLLTGLQDLRLDDNQLSSLPAEMRLLTHLKELTIENNPLRYLPAGIRLLSICSEEAISEFQHLLSVEDLNELENKRLSETTTELQKSCLSQLFSLQKQHREIIDTLSSPPYLHLLSAEELEQLQDNHCELMEKLVQLQQKLPSSFEEMTAFNEQLEPYFTILNNLQQFQLSLESAGKPGRDDLVLS